MALIRAYEEHKATSEYKQAVQLFQKQQDSQKRLSHKLWWAQCNYTKGKSLSAQVKDKSFDLFAFDATDQELVHAFDTRQSARALDVLLEQKRPPYRGAGSATLLSLS